jgi:hypothetical protein
MHNYIIRNAALIIIMSVALKRTATGVARLRAVRYK